MLLLVKLLLHFLVEIVVSTIYGFYASAIFAHKQYTFDELVYRLFYVTLWQVNKILLELSLDNNIDIPHD